MKLAPEINPPNHHLKSDLKLHLKFNLKYHLKSMWALPPAEAAPEIQCEIFDLKLYETRETEMK